MFFSLYGKKRIPLGGMTLLHMLQDPQYRKVEKSIPIYRRNTSSKIVAPVIESNTINECKNKEKDIVIYYIGCEEPMPVVEEPVIETLHNPNQYMETLVEEEEEADHDEEESHEEESHEEESHEEESHEEENQEGEDV